MTSEQAISIKKQTFIASKLQDYTQLMKPNLSFMVVFSSIIGYLLVPGINFDWKNVLLLFIGGMLITNSANIINQILERESDKYMKRTMNRPLPEKRMTTTEAWLLSALSGCVGCFILSYQFNLICALLGLLSLILYAFAYTPMKKIHPIAVLIGAIPGALPPLIGWVAACGTLSISEFGIGGYILFSIQFFWQFPHFWAIAWVGYEDYLKAGIKMLPSNQGKTTFTGLQCMFYSLPLIPLAMMPYYLHLSGKGGMIVAVIAGIAYFIASTHFYLKNNKKSAKMLMYTSFIYLPTVLLAIILSKN